MSVLHASFREQARRARLAGDTDAEAMWRAREERVQEILQEANHAALVYVQEHAGFTRTGRSQQEASSTSIPDGDVAGDRARTRV